MPLDPPKFEPGKTYLMSGKTLNLMGDAIRARTVIAGRNVRLRETEQGVIVSATGGGAAGDLCAFEGVSSGGNWKILAPGTLNGYEPENLYGGGVLNTFAIAANRWLVLAVTATDNQVQSSAFAVRSTPPVPIAATEGVAPGEFDIPLYFFNATLVAHRLIGCASLWATAEEVMRTSNPDPTPCGDPYVRWYSWKWGAA